MLRRDAAAVQHVQRSTPFQFAIRPRTAALVCALIAALVVWFAWNAGSFHPAPSVEDEYSYVLQSRIFASGRWTAPSPPLPEFFQQAHVLTVPAVASKYPPGHALLMSIGSRFGAPALVPLLLTALTGALLFLLVRRATNAWVALLAFVLWIGDPLNLTYRAAYYSEVTTSAAWFVSWWALLRWRDTRSRKWLLTLAAAIGWGAITRPLTMLAFAVPVGVLVVRDVARLRAWRDFAIAMALGIAILGVLPLWSARTTGDWRLTPQSLYTRDYLPYDKPGFGVDTTSPAMKLSPVNEFTYAGFYAEHAHHTIANLPHTVVDRLSAIGAQEWRGARLVLVPFALIGLFSMTPEIAFALICSIALFVGYLSYGHWAAWTIYYFEAFPVLSVLAALGVWRTVSLLARRTSSATLEARALGAIAVLFGFMGLTVAVAQRRDHIRAARPEQRVRDALSGGPAGGAVVFVHYVNGLHPHVNLVQNSPDLGHEPIWFVNDMGERDGELMQYAGARLPLVFDERNGQLSIDSTLIRRRAPR